jgi:shikimate dehydrogenase/3-dehydroquinate dehydratase type I
MTKVAAVIRADNAAEAERQSRMALGKGADLVELRLDYVRDVGPSAIRKLANAVGNRAIATLRSPAQGGASVASSPQRTTILQEICRSRFAYVDLELETDRDDLGSLTRLASGHRTTVIVSHHFAQAAEVHRVSEALDACAAQGEVAKVAVPANDFEDAVQLVDLIRSRSNRPHRFVLIGMGTGGTVTRALADSLGQEIQYASWGLSAAPGQLPLRTAARLRGREPMILGLIGHPVAHSISSTMHEAALAALDLPAAYLPFDTPPDALDSFLLAADRLRIRGFNVTSPHKEAVARSVDELDGDAERLGVVNTVVLREGWTTGHNTDVYGFRVSLRSLGLRIGDRTALVVGAGGAARAVVDVLLREGARVQVTNRTAARAEALAESFDDRIEVLPPGVLVRKGPWDLLVNATPVGTKGVSDGLPVPEPVIGKAGFIYDLVYNPQVTPLLRAAKRLNRPGASGLAMLLQQGAKAFELWTGRAAPFEAMQRAAKEALP